MRMLKDEHVEDLMCKGLKIIQNKNLYHFTSDAVCLANFVKGGYKDEVCELCSGSGVISILLTAKINPKHITMVEIQKDLAKMSQKSVQLNQLEDQISVINKPLQNINQTIGNNFSVVVVNPPYKKVNGNLISEDQKKAICKHEICVNLEEIVSESSKLLKFGGRFYIVIIASRFVELINLLQKYNLEPKRIAMINNSLDINTIMIEAKKGGKAGIEIKLFPRI